MVADRRSPRDGRTIETIGHYNAQADPSVIVIDEDRARHWLDHGAEPTRTVAHLLRTKGIEATALAARMRDLVEFLVRALVSTPTRSRSRRSTRTTGPCSRFASPRTISAA